MKDNFIPPGPLITPVLFMIFNRPDTTQKVFDAIKQAKPKQLFVAADGPREDKEGEKEKCEQAREIIEQVAWDCEVKKLFRDNNLGCKIAVSSAIDWFFENVEEGIILEDDCLPNQSFFWFCQEMLKYYRNDTRIMHISGDNFQFGRKRGEGSYYFSKYAHVWGWATWKRAWKHYDVDMKNFIKFKIENQIENIFKINQQKKYWMKIFQLVYDGKIDTWDYIWVFFCFINNGLCIMPNKNLVSNIGFSEDALHTKDEKSVFSKIKADEMTKILHPEFLTINREADYFTFRLFFSNRYIVRRVINKVIRMIRKNL